MTSSPYILLFEDYISESQRTTYHMFIVLYCLLAVSHGFIVRYITTSLSVALLIRTVICTMKCYMNK